MRKATWAAVLLAGLLVFPTGRAAAEVKLHGLFGDHMVLQRDMKVPVWGTADPGEAVTVEFDGQKVAGKADDKGKWLVTLEPLKAGGPHKLMVKGDKGTVTLDDVLVGEVWIASGQSNMEWSLRLTRDPKDVIANAKNDKIRLFDVPKKPNAAPQTAIAAPYAEKGGREFGKWLECNPTSVPQFSAVGYYFGRKLEKDLGVPVAIINSSWGGTAAERWTPRDVMDSDPELKGIKGGADLYNGMIASLKPFAFRGVIWYQGESNAGRAKQYFHLMNALIKSWRDDWKQEFPFLTVQLAPYEPGNYAEIREAQWFTTKKLPKVGMAVITDAGDPKDIHPKDKAVVGERLALLAENMAYGKKIVANGPEFDSVKFEGGKAVLTFKNAGGLAFKGGTAQGFTIAGKDGKFVKANATIVENTVVVESPDVQEPAAVRYGWANYPVCNLYNAEGLPATPFRTDVPGYLK